MNKKVKLFFFSLLCTFASFSFAHAQPVQVASSFSILTDLIEQVGGEHVQVYTLIKENVDAHSFAPSAQDARQLSKVQLLFANGLEFEPWLERLQNASHFQGKTIIVSDGIHPHKTHARERHEDEGLEHGEYDPHAWQNVMNVIIYVQNITSALEAIDPEHAAYYQARSLSYIKQLEALDADIIKAIEQIPPERRVLVSMHDSFVYFGQRYALKTVGVLSASHEAQPSASVIAKLIQQIKQQHIPALFLDNTSNPKLLEQIARETDAVLGGKLYADALSQKGSPSDTYLKMMRTNLNVLCHALCMKN